MFLGLAAEKGFPHKGSLDLIANRFDERTGTIQLRSVLANADGRLVPGMFARVRLPLGKPRKVLEVPELAVLSKDGAKFVYVIGADKKVQLRRVKLGPLDGGQRVIKEGLKPEDWVAVSALGRFAEGDTVEPKACPCRAVTRSRVCSLQGRAGGVNPLILGNQGETLSMSVELLMDAQGLIVIDTNAVPWEERFSDKLGRALYRKNLVTDPDTGMEVRLVRYPAGVINVRHTHPCAHGMYVLEGTLETHAGRYGPGCFVWFPEGTVMEHGASTAGDVTVLFITNKPFAIDYR